MDNNCYTANGVVYTRAPLPPNADSTIWTGIRVEHVAEMNLDEIKLYFPHLVEIFEEEGRDPFEYCEEEYIQTIGKKLHQL